MPEPFDPETAANQIGIKSLQVENGKFELSAVAAGDQAEELLLAMTDALGQMLDKHDATNYVEFEVKKRHRPAYVVNVRRYGHPTPHKLREEAEARAKAAEAILAEIKVMARASADAESERREGHFSAAVETLLRIERAADRALNGADRA